MWTGIANPADFTAGDSCNGWSDMTNLSTGFGAIPTARDGYAFGNQGFGCGFFQFWIYCVEQP